jgi:hypothetical protein
MKTLLALGCSFTDKDFHSRIHPEMDCSWPKWPEIVGEKLGYNVVNLGESGGSNDLLAKRGIDYIAHNKVDMICVLYTSIGRLNVHDSLKCNWRHEIQFYHDNQDGLSVKEGGVWRDEKPYKKEHDRSQSKTLENFNMSNLVKSIFTGETKHRYDKESRANYLNLPNEYLRNIYMLERIAQSYDIPIYHQQGTQLLNIWDFRNFWSKDYYKMKEKEVAVISYERFRLFLKAYIDCKYFSILDRQSNIYGWPFYKELGGFTCKDTINTIPNAKISDEDGHPNALGNTLIADNFVEMIA